MTRFTIALLLSGLVAFSSGSFADDASENQSEKQINLFVTLDQNGDGTLKNDEVDESQQRAFERLLRVGDANADGQLTRDEYLSGLKPVTAGEVDPPNRGRFSQREGQQRLDIGRVFDMADRDGDGRIVLGDLPGAMQARLQPLFERLGKGEISRNDFEHMRSRAAYQPPGQDGGGRQLALIWILDADENGQLSRSELARIGKRFAELDRNDDGQLDSAELILFYEGLRDRRNLPERPGFTRRTEQMRRPQGATDRARRRPEARPQRPQNRGSSQVIRQFDADEDGTLNIDEAPERIAERFDRLDANSDGKLTADELGRAFGAGRGNPGRD